MNKMPEGPVTLDQIRMHLAGFERMTVDAATDGIFLIQSYQNRTGHIDDDLKALETYFEGARAMARYVSSQIQKGRQQ